MDLLHYGLRTSYTPKEWSMVCLLLSQRKARRGKKETNVPLQFLRSTPFGLFGSDVLRATLVLDTKLQLGSSRVFHRVASTFGKNC